MPELSIFIPLAKVDVARRRLYGVMTAETPDKSGEIMDYATGKPAIQTWSDSLSKASDGKNKGNVRVMHGKAPKFGLLPVGRVVEIDFDDLNKSVAVEVEVDDDDALAMCEKGTLTGFSIGGGYARRWADGAHKRYTPALSELSIVDNPCLGDARFELVKVDGTIEQVAFAGFEPGADATKAYAEKLAKDAGKPDRRNDYVSAARDELIKLHVEGAEYFVKGDDGEWSLQKVAAAEDEEAPADKAKDDEEDKEEDKDAPVEKVAGGAVLDPVAAVEAALAKASGAAGVVVVNDQADGPFSDLIKLMPALVALRDQADTVDPLRKSLFTLEWMAELMAGFKNLTDCMNGETFWEGASQANVDSAKKILADIGTLFLATAQDEVASATDILKVAGVEFATADAAVLELGKAAMAVVESDLPLMEKVGKRNSARDETRIQTIHDHACDLGAACEPDVEKLAKSQTEVTRLSDALQKVAPQIEGLGRKIADQAQALAKANETNADLEKRLAKIEEQPAPPKGVLRVLTKNEDDGGSDAPLEKVAREGSIHDQLAQIKDPVARGQYLLRHAVPAPGQGSRT